MIENSDIPKYRKRKDSASKSNRKFGVLKYERMAYGGRYATAI